jgi:hypothetical protein
MSAGIPLIDRFPPPPVDPFTAAAAAVTVHAVARGRGALGLVLRCTACGDSAPLPAAGPTVGALLDLVAAHWATHEPKGGDEQ